jgi:hypothetical protein
VYGIVPIGPEAVVKSFTTLLLIAVFPILANAADRYTYECENDANGGEGLCIAVPIENKQAANSMIDKGRPPKDRSKMIADKPAKNVFRASDVVSSEANTNQADLPNTENLEGAAANISAQEKIRQVEQFLQPTKGPQGLGDDGPTKAGH